MRMEPNERMALQAILLLPALVVWTALLLLAGWAPAVGAVAGAGLGRVVMRGIRGPRSSS